MGCNYPIKNDSNSARIKPPSPYVPKLNVGLILNVSNENLNELIKFDGKECFFRNFCTDLNAEIITLINGDKETPFYELNNVMKSAIKYFEHKKTMDSLAFGAIGIFCFFLKIPLLFPLILWNIYSHSCPKESISKYELTNSNIILNSISEIESFSKDNKVPFQFFDKNEPIPRNPQSISLIVKLKYLIEKLSKDSHNFEKKYIIIISDGTTIEKYEEAKELILKAKEKNIIIVTFLLSKNKIKEKKCYENFPNNLDNSLKNLYEVSSKVDYKNIFAKYFIENGWLFPGKGKGILLFQTSLEDLNDPDNSLTCCLKNISKKEIIIKMEEYQRNIFINYKYKFVAKNQIFGTCWANSYAAAIFLTNKRIFGRKTESFEDIRQQLIKYACDMYIDGGNIENPKVKNFFQRKRLCYDEIDKYYVEKIVEKGIFVVCSFCLTDTQWKNFSNYYREEPDGTLTKELLNKDCENKKDENEDRHAVLLIETGDGFLKFLNSWSSNWANGGRFKIKDADVLTSYNKKEKAKFYYIYYVENDLTDDEKDYYKNNIQYINDLISHYSYLGSEDIINDIKKYKKYTYKCKKCNCQMRFQDLKIKIEKGVYKMICQSCKEEIDPDNWLRDYLLLRDLMDDGTENFYFKQNYEIAIERVEFHKELKKKKKLKNESDLCSIGLKNSKKEEIDSYFNNKINCIINLKDNIFIACGSGVILIFELTFKSIININNKKELKKEYNILLIKTASNVEFIYLCSLNDNDFIASGDNILYLLKFDNNNNSLITQDEFKCKGIINKIILYNTNNSTNKKIFTCDNLGYICIYTISKKFYNRFKISLTFINKFHESSINSILYLPDDNILVSGSNEDKKLIFYNITENSIENKNILYNYSTKYTESLIDIKSNNIDKLLSYLLIGEEDGIMVIQHKAHNKIKSKNYKDKEFGGVYSIKSLGYNYIICGRSFGFCSIFLLQEDNLMKINVFRNNNLRASNRRYDLKNDSFYITNICVKDVLYEKEGKRIRYILIGSFDRTLKVYYYEISHI